MFLFIDVYLDIHCFQLFSDPTNMRKRKKKVGLRIKIPCQIGIRDRAFLVSFLSASSYY